MICIICGVTLMITQINSTREINYCSEYCRLQYYRNQRDMKDIRLALDTNDFNQIGRFKLSKFIRLGFKVLIFEKEIEVN